MSLSSLFLLLLNFLDTDSEQNISPSGHSRQPEEPIFEYVFSGHFLQLAEPSVSANYFSGLGVHTESPFLENFPFGQFWHLADFDFENVPTGKDIHLYEAFFE